MNHIFTLASFLFFVKMNNITEEKNTRDFSPTFFCNNKELIQIRISTITLGIHYKIVQSQFDIFTRLDFIKLKKIWY